MNVARRFLAWMKRPQISLVDRIAIFVAFSGLGLLCAMSLLPVFDGTGVIRRVHGHGTDTLARVERDPGFSDWSRIVYDGHTASVPRESVSDERPPVTYLAAEPSVFAFGHANDGLFTLYMANVGLEKSCKFIMGLVGALGCLACVLASLAPAGRPQRGK